MTHLLLIAAFFFAFLSDSIAESLVDKVSFPSDFLFGVASAPAHVEDDLDGIWIEYGKKGKIAGFKNANLASNRLYFWMRPQEEIDWVSKLGVNLYRLGVSWQRIEPAPGDWNEESIERYKKILSAFQKKGVKVMLTLFHHSEPKWLLAKGSWDYAKAREHFVRFAKKVITELGDSVDYLLTFNEAQIYAVMTRVSGLWPSPEKASGFELVNIPFRPGAVSRYLSQMALAHRDIYRWCQKRSCPFSISIAHNMAYYRGLDWLGSGLAFFADKKMNWEFLDLIGSDLDFLGINYYGAEWFGVTGPQFKPETLYSEAGRAVHPSGLFSLLRDVQKYYQGLRI